MKLNAYKLRRSSSSEKEKGKIKKNDIYIVLDNVLDTYNVGAIFRLADAVAAKKLLPGLFKRCRNIADLQIE